VGPSSRGPAVIGWCPSHLRIARHPLARPLASSAAGPKYLLEHPIANPRETDKKTPHETLSSRWPAPGAAAGAATAMAARGQRRQPSAGMARCGGGRRGAGDAAAAVRAAPPPPRRCGDSERPAEVGAAASGNNDG
jgi:hypothetical protein